MNTHATFRLQTEIAFTLNRGYLDPAGVLHREGRMRLATAADEILPQRDPRVQQNPAYLAVIVLSRVVTRLGTLEDIDVSVIEGLFASDFDQLQALYERFNGDGAESESAAPPRAQAGFADDLDPIRGMPVLGEA
jgi:hypothetical protein